MSLKSLTKLSQIKMINTKKKNITLKLNNDNNNVNEKLNSTIITKLNNNILSYNK